MFVDAEVMASGFGIAVYRNSIRAWRPPHESDGVDDRQRDRILDNIRRAIESQWPGEPVRIY